MWSQHCRIPRWLRCWFEVLFIVATKMRTVARQSYTGAREKLTELRGVKRARRFPLPRCLLSEEATSFTKVNWWRCQQYQRFADKKPAKSYKLSWNFCDLKNITKNMPEISTEVSTIGNGTSFDGFSNTNIHSFNDSFSALFTLFLFKTLLQTVFAKQSSSFVVCVQTSLGSKWKDVKFFSPSSCNTNFFSG